jgi:ribonuclease Z
LVINGIFIAHLHSDHPPGLPGLYATPNCYRLPSADEKRHWIFWGPVGIDNVARGIESMLTDNNRFHVAGGEAVADATYITVHQLSEATGMWA